MGFVNRVTSASAEMVLNMTLTQLAAFQTVAMIVRMEFAGLLDFANVIQDTNLVSIHVYQFVQSKSV